MIALARMIRGCSGPFWVWRRNARVWGKQWRSSLVGTIGEPLFYFLGLGYGLGTLLPAIGGEPYLHYVVPGLMISSVMHSTTIEATYSTFTKLEHQRVHASMLLAPLDFDDIFAGEMLWAVTKGMTSGLTVFALALAWGLGDLRAVLGMVPLLAFAGGIFAALGMSVTAVARGYESFSYYFTLVISPMFFFSGIFFPLDSLAPWVRYLSWCFPLTHLVNLARCLFRGQALVWGDLFWLAIFAAAVLLAGRQLMHRRFRP